MPSQSKTAGAGSNSSSIINKKDKWREQMYQGDITEITSHFSRHWESVEPKETMMVVTDISKMLVKFQDTPKKINVEMIIDLLLFCGRALGYEGQRTKSDVQILNISIILFCMHSIIYIGQSERCFEKVCLLSNMLLEVGKDVYNLPDEKLQPALKRIEHSARYLWKSALKLERNKESLEVFCRVLELMSLLNSPTIFKEMCNLAESLIACFGAKVNFQGTFLQIVLKSIKFKRQTEITPEEEDKAELLLSRILKYLHTETLERGVTQVQREFEAVQNMNKGFFCTRTFDAAVAVYKTLAAFIKNHGDTNTIKQCRSYLVNDRAGRFAASVLLPLVKSTLSGTTFSRTTSIHLIRELQSLLLVCIPLSPVEDQFRVADVILRLAEREVQDEIQIDKWEDGGKIGIAIACDAIKAIETPQENVDEMLCQDIGNFFHFIGYMACKLSMSDKMCYYESQMLYDALNKKVYQIISIFLAHKTCLSKSLNELAIFVRNANFVYCSAGGKNGENRYENAILSVLLYLAAVVKSKAYLEEDDYNTKLQGAVKLWQEMGQKLCTAYPDKQTKSIVGYWQLYKKNLASRLNSTLDKPDWETILIEEIYSYNEMLDYADLILLAANELENLKVKSTDKLQAARTTLALAYAKNKEAGADGPAASQAICTTVITSLSDEKDKCAELLVVLMEAYLQQYISYQKDQRKQGEKLAELPLTTRSPPMKVGPGGESQAVEAWEEAEELSQLGKELSCRQEARNIYPLTNLLSLAMLLERKLDGTNISSSRKILLEPALNILESVCYICGTMGQYWMALKSWGLVFSIANFLECPQTQLLAVTMMSSRYSIQKGSKEEQWLEENLSTLRLTFSDSIEDQTKLKICELNLARCFYLSDRLSESAEIVLSILNNVKPGYLDQRELVIRAYMLASQLLVALSPNDKQWKQLLELVQGPLEAAEWASMSALKSISENKPPERNTKELRKLELIIESSLWVVSLATWTGSYRSACISLQILLKRVQLLMLPTRVAQVLSCFGDLDLMTPDKAQLEQRLFWNQKILSLGSAIEGSKIPKTPKRTYTVGTSPTRFNAKQYQLTAYCSERCMKSDKSKGCSLCKYPLYHVCKAHYAILVEGNDQTFMRLNEQLQITWKESASRLWDLTWGNVIEQTSEKNSSAQGWLPMLLDPITLLECRVKLGSAVVQAGKGNSREALETLKELIVTLKGLKHELAPVMLCWAQAQVVACHMQIRGLGGFASKLKCQVPLSVPIDANGLLGVDENKSPRKALTPKQTPAVTAAPKRPGRRPTKKIAAINESPVPLPAVPKLVLPEQIETSPSNKKKIISTAEKKPTKLPAGRKRNNKENLELPIYDAPTFVLPSTKGPRSKRTTKDDTVKKANLAAFPVYEDNSTPAKNKYCNGTPMSIAKPSSKSYATPCPLPSSTKKTLKRFEWSPSSNESPSKFVTPQPSARVYSSTSTNKKNVACPSTTKRLLAKRESVISISSSEDSPIATKSTAKNSAVLNKRPVISSVRKPVKLTTSSPLSSSSTASPILPPKSCSRGKKAVIGSSTDSSPDLIKRPPMVKPSTTNYSTKQSTTKQGSSNGSFSPVVNKHKVKSFILVDSSSEESSPSFKKSDKQANLTKTYTSAKTQKVINKVEEIPTTSKTNNMKSNEGVTKSAAIKNLGTIHKDNAIIIDSDVSLIENSIIEEKPKRAQILTRTARK